MLIADTNRKLSYIGKITCLVTFSLGLIYIFTTFFGFLSLNSPDEPIGDPYFIIMEVLTLIIAPFMALVMISIHYHTSTKYRLNSLFAVLSMFLMAGITSSVHFVVLTMHHQLDPVKMGDLTLFFSFKWPSVVYILDILAWDWFFALSFLLAAPIFNNGRLEKSIKALMIISGTLSLIGIVGVPLENMQIRNIGIIGYALIAPFAFLLIGLNFSRIQIKNKRKQNN